jgi:hypothetical protein
MSNLCRWCHTIPAKFGDSAAKCNCYVKAAALKENAAKNEYTCKNCGSVLIDD